MVQLSQNFALDEFQKNEPIPAVAIPTFAVLATQILEPVRAFLQEPLLITSGYRSPEANVAAHGQPNSEHVATADYCAADFYCGLVPARTIFDYMRNNSMIPFHQLILEHGANGSSIVHVSYNRLKVGVRSVLEGATHNSEPYIKCDYVAYLFPPIESSGDIHTEAD
jgi:zinc D-Ala-D-Ala carboxypeptidase